MKKYAPRNVFILELLYEIAIGAFSFSLLFWISDIISVLIKRFKVPVVLGEKGGK